ncbi:hypothetical protein CNR22_22320 [Sphingobacteriaceae bacterium]|nr:hypothetical protein CNR22_22320 [Sphingobacteriaceae bacterium]
MKKIIVVLFVLVGHYLSAQSSCANAAPFCAGGQSGITFPATSTTGTPQSAETGPNYGCLGSTPNPAWYYLQISNSGNLDILIQGQATSPPGPGSDVDFICYGPFNSLTGACNSLTAGNTVDCSYSGSYTETLNISNGVVGQYYMVLITNFANVQQDIEFSQFGGNGTTNCALLTNNSKICAGSSGTVVATNTSSLTTPSYSMNPGNLTSSTGSFVVTPTVTTVYTVYISGTTAASVVITQTAASTVSVDPQPTVVPTVTNTSCTSTLNAFNLNLSFFPATPAPGYTVNWASVPNGVTSNTTTFLSGSGIPAGPYTATVTAAGGCSAVANFTLNPVPAPALITILPAGPVYSVTCLTPTVNLISQVSTNTYTWTNGTSTVINGSVAAITNSTIGNYTLYALNPVSGCTSFQTFTVGLNISTPSATLNPLFQNITCNLTSITTITSVASPTINITQQIQSPSGGTFATTSNTLVYLPGGVGNFTHCVINDINGCSSCRIFTVSSNQGFPTYNVLSPDNFTLGCNSKSVAVINIVNGNTSPQGGPVSYTLLPPGASSVTLSGNLSVLSTYSVNVPGTWTVITKDNTSFCETRTPISILSNTLGPDLNTSVPRTILDCYVPTITLRGSSSTPNVNYLWSFAGTPGSLQGDSITVYSNSIAPTSSVVGNYTLTIRDNSSTCKTDTVVIMRQNLYKPIAAISAGSPSLTCLTSTIVLTNQSSSTIPPATGFSQGLPAIGFLWQGPSPQEPRQLTTTYIAGTTGIYTITAKDLNNGCTSTGTIVIGDYRKYPDLEPNSTISIDTLDCGSNFFNITPPLILSPENKNYAYSWIAPSNASISSSSSASISINKAGNYRVVITNTANGCSTPAQVTVINGTLDASFTADNMSGYAPLNVTFSNTSSSSLNSSGINAYWNFGNSTATPTLSTLSTANAIYTQPGTYTVSLYVTKGSCLDTAQLVIQVDIPSAIEIPNIFTPNGDNVNDLFFLKSSNLDKITMQVFDRWGNLVFDIQSASGNVSWDGKYESGKEAAPGVYFYIIKANGKDGSKYDKKGTITLVR